MEIGKAISEFELNNSSDKVIGIDLQESSNLEKFENFIYLKFNCTEPLIIEEHFEKYFS